MGPADRRQRVGERSTEGRMPVAAARPATPLPGFPFLWVELTR